MTDQMIPAWFDHALCVEVDSDIFFPEKGASTREAIAVCTACQVRETCAQYAINGHFRHGVWGGMSERERRAVA